MCIAGFAQASHGDCGHIAWAASKFAPNLFITRKDKLMTIASPAPACIFSGPATICQTDGNAQVSGSPPWVDYQSQYPLFGYNGLLFHHRARTPETSSVVQLFGPRAVMIAVKIVPLPAGPVISTPPASAIEGCGFIRHRRAADRFMLGSPAKAPAISRRPMATSDPLPTQ